VTLRLSQAQVSLIILGWALAQFPYLVEPDITIYSAAAPRTTLQFLIAALAAGVLVLLSCLLLPVPHFQVQTMRSGKLLM
jgi:cytochrome bd ubiquinol oxidase subunit II